MQNVPYLCTTNFNELQGQHKKSVAYSVPNISQQKSIQYSMMLYEIDSLSSLVKYLNRRIY